jgi:hypothetical protein
VRGNKVKERDVRRRSCRTREGEGRGVGCTGKRGSGGNDKKEEKKG